MCIRDRLATLPGFEWIQKLGVNLISIFVVFALLYWVGMARIVRSQVLMPVSYTHLPSAAGAVPTAWRL